MPNLKEEDVANIGVVVSDFFILNKAWILLCSTFFA